jgi:hypothetical protein
MLTLHLQGGLGNQLFQLAFLEYASKVSGKPWGISSLQSPTTVHSKDQYFISIFKNWIPFYNPVSVKYSIVENPKLAKQDWKTILEEIQNPVLLIGYFQRYEYVDLIREQFITRLSFNQSVLDKYPDLQNSFFIHIRGGDYLNKPFHELCTKKYYQKCLELCKDETFVVFTNDIPYANKMLEQKQFQIIQESEVDSLFLMSKCKGCICANSSFSWWGAYLNPNRPIYFPSKWFGDSSMDTSGYYFKGCTIIDV